MVDWQSPNEISNELGTPISFHLPIFPVIVLLFLPLDSLSLVEAANKFAHVVDGLYLCVCFFTYRPVPLPPLKTYNKL